MNETPTMELRWIEAFSCDEPAFSGKFYYGSEKRYKLQQKWIVDDPKGMYIKWKDIEISYD